MLANLLEHVIKETKTGRDVATSRAVKICSHVDIGLFCGACHFSPAFSCKEQFGNLVPVHAVFPENERFASNVFRKLTVGLPVADDKAISDIVFGIVEIFCDKSGVWLPRGSIVLGEVAVYEYLVERNALSFESL